MSASLLISSLHPKKSPLKMPCASVQMWHTSLSFTFTQSYWGDSYMQSYTLLTFFRMILFIFLRYILKKSCPKIYELYRSLCLWHAAKASQLNNSDITGVSYCLIVYSVTQCLMHAEMPSNNCISAPVSFPRYSDSCFNYFGGLDD